MAKKWWLLLVTFGLFFVFMIPPFQKNDETAHFYRTVSVKNGQFSCNNGYIAIQKGWFDYIYYYDFSEVLKGKNFALSSFDFSRKFDSSSTIEKVGGWCGLSPLGYIPNALGLLIGQLLSNSTLLIFYAGRLAGFGFFLILLAICLSKIKPEFRKIIGGFAFTPMVLSSVTGYSYDVVILSLVPLVFTAIINLIYGYKAKYSQWYGYISLIIISVIKIVYAPLFGIFFLFSVQKSRLKSVLILGLSLVLTFGLMKAFNRSNVVTNYSLFGNPLLQARLILADPFYYAQVWTKTLADNWLQYYRGMVALVGWSGTLLTYQSAYLFYLGAGLWTIISIPKKLLDKISLKQAFFILFCAFISLVGVMTAMYLMASVIADDHIVGAQGRYFLPLLPFVVLALAKIWQELLKRPVIHRYLMLGVVLFLFFASVVSVYQRYYDPGNHAEVYLMPTPTTTLQPQKKTDWVVVDKAFSFMMPVDVEQYVVGVAIGLGGRDKAVNIPYRVEIRDSQCQKIIKRWYLKQFDIQWEADYKQLIEPVKLPSTMVCIKVIPMTLGIAYTDSFMSLRKIDGTVDWQWLYEDKDAYLKL